MSISPQNCSSQSISIIHICLDMFSASCCLFSVAIFGSSCSSHQMSFPRIKMSLPHIKNGCHVSSLNQNACRYVFHTCPLDSYMFSTPICCYFIFLSTSSIHLPHSDSFSSLLFFSISSIIPPSHYTCTYRRRGRTLSEQLYLCIVSKTRMSRA